MKKTMRRAGRWLVACCASQAAFAQLAIGECRARQARALHEICGARRPFMT